MAEDIFTHYRIDGDGNYWFHDNRSVRPNLPPAFYTIGFEPMSGQLFLTPRDSLVDEIVPLPNPHANQSLSIAQRFIAGEFKQGLDDIGLINKMAMMLWGEPGTSKTVTIHQIMEYAIAKDWVVLDGSSRLSHIAPTIRQIRMVEKGRGVVVIWEEFERLINDGYETEILQLLDGSDQLPNVLYIMTTNYITQVPKRIFTRCRRIPFQVEFEYPGAEERRAYFSQKVPEKYKGQVDIEDWVDKTEGFSIDHCAQVLVGVFAFGQSVDTVIEDLKTRMAIYGGGGARMDVEPKFDKNVSEDEQMAVAVSFELENMYGEMKADTSYDPGPRAYETKAAGGALYTKADLLKKMAHTIRTANGISKPRMVRKASGGGVPLIVL